MDVFNYVNESIVHQLAKFQRNLPVLLYRRILILPFGSSFLEQKRELDRKTTITALLVVTILLSSLAIALGAPPDYSLHVNGTNIVNSAGTTVYLFGATLDHNEWSKEFFTNEDIDRLKEYGANIVEIHQARLARLKPTRDTFNETYLRLIDNVANRCEAAKVYYIINIEDLSYTIWASGMPDWMLDGHGYGAAPYSETIVKQACLDFWDLSNPLHDDNRKAFVDLWVYLAIRYNKPHALYSIVNEPISHIPLGTGTESSESIGRSYAQFMTEVIDAIHKVSSNLIVVDRPYLWYQGDIQPISREGIIWEDHAYVNEAGEFEINTWKAYVDNSKDLFMKDFGKPLCIGEFGPLPVDMPSWDTVLRLQVEHINRQVAIRDYNTWGVLNGESNQRFSYEQSEQLLTILFPREPRGKR